MQLTMDAQEDLHHAKIFYKKGVFGFSSITG
jgi:hypothetical protein